MPECDAVLDFWFRRGAGADLERHRQYWNGGLRGGAHTAIVQHLYLEQGAFPHQRRSDSMPTDLPLRCSCGAVTGTLRGVASRRGNRLVCYCDDCQSFAHFLRRPPSGFCARTAAPRSSDLARAVAVHRGIGRVACMPSRGAARFAGMRLLSGRRSATLRHASGAVHRLIHSCIAFEATAARATSCSGRPRSHLHALRRGRSRGTAGNERSSARLILRVLPLLRRRAARRSRALSRSSTRAPGSRSAPRTCSARTARRGRGGARNAHSRAN